MKNITGIIFLLLILHPVMTFSEEESIYDACVHPESPAIPGGNVTEDQLKEAVSIVKTFQVELNLFRACLDELKVTIDEETMDEETVKNNKNINLKLDSIYNVSVDREQAVVDLLNKQIRIYKSKNEFNNAE